MAHPRRSHPDVASVASAVLLAAPSAMTAEAGLALPAEKRTVSTGAAEIARHETGKGAPVVFVLGMPSSSSIARSVLPEPDQEPNRLFALDGGQRRQRHRHLPERAGARRAGG